MTNANKQIKISSILYLLSALLTIPFVPILGAILLIIGAILLSNSFLSLEELKKNKVVLTIITAISFILNIPAAVMIILSLDEISTIKVEKNNAPPPTTERKRIDLLLKLGLAMILISGVLFATTTWEALSNIIKIVALVVMGVIFILLSMFSEKRLKIESTTKAYYILGLSFFLLTWVGIGYFGIISQWFSYTGEGWNLVYFITFILLGVFLYLINHKFREKEYLYLGHISIYLSIYYLLASIGLSLIQVTTILSVISLIVNIIPNNKFLSTIKEINIPISYLFWSIILTQCIEANKYIILIACVINIGNLSFLTLTNKSATNQLMSVVINYILLTIGTLKLSLTLDNCVALFTVISVFSLLLKYQKINQSKYIVSTSQIIYNTLSTILLLIISTYSAPKTFIISAIYLGLNIFNSLDIYQNNEQVDFRYNPIVIIAFLLSTIYFLNDVFLVNIHGLLTFSLASVIYTAIHQMAKKKQIKDYYLVTLIISLVITFFLTMMFGKILVSIINLLLSIYLYFIQRKSKIGARILLYIFILCNIVATSLVLTNYGFPIIMSHIITLSIFGILALFNQEPKIKTTSYLAIVVPLYSLVNTINIDAYLKLIIDNIFCLYILFLIVKFLIKNKKTKDIMSTIGLTLIILTIIFNVNILIGLYIGILSIIIIFATFKEENYKKLFYSGIIITIINIVIQLWGLWTQVPFWLYLLLVGLGIIFFVTYKEMHKKEGISTYQNKVSKIENKTSSNVEKNIQSSSINDVEQLEKISNNVDRLVNTVPSVSNFCPACGTKNDGGKFCRTCGKNLQK